MSHVLTCGVVETDVLVCVVNVSVVDVAVDQWSPYLVAASRQALYSFSFHLVVCVVVWYCIVVIIGAVVVAANQWLPYLAVASRRTIQLWPMLLLHCIPSLIVV